MAIRNLLEEEPMLNHGAELAPDAPVNLPLSAGRSLVAPNAGEPELLGYVGVQLLY